MKLPLIRRASRPQVVLAGLVAASGLAWYLAEDWIAAAALLVLAVVWVLLRAEWGPPVLALALTFQWNQAALGIFYYAFTGRRALAMDASEYRPMVLIALGCVLALALGLHFGIKLIGRLKVQPRPTVPLSWPALVTAYIVAIPVTGVLQEAAWDYPVLTQAILALSFVRLALLFLILRRISLSGSGWHWFVLILAFEVGLGFTGYFAGFREPVVVATFALLDAFDRRNKRQWAALSGLALAALVMGVLWMGVRQQYRQEFYTDVFVQSRTVRLERMASLSQGWAKRESYEFLNDIDLLVERMWAIYYPALALARVPSVLPHTEGEILGTALRHISTPRVFFMDKDVLKSDSEMVREYSGVWVAGPEQDTSIAFGYAIESYVDFGVPWMFVPVFVFGVLMGVAYRFFLRAIWHRELAIGLVTIVFWLSLYLFERSWIKTLGFTGTLMIYLGLAAMLIDRLLAERRAPSTFTRNILPQSPGIPNLRHRIR